MSLEALEKRRNALREINSVAENMKKLLQCHRPPTSLAAQESTSIPPLGLPPVEDLLSDLLTSRLPLNKSGSAFMSLSSSIKDSQIVYSTHYAQSCQRLLRISRAPGSQPVSALLENLRRVYQDMYIQQYSVSMKGQIVAAEATWKRHRRAPETQRKPFHNEYIPLLEKYFEYNAYPSKPDRLVLARKSMMSPRQIEVWFQNHRSRARKEGKSLRKLSCDPLPYQLSFETLKHSMAFFAAPDDHAMHLKLDAGESSEGEAELVTTPQKDEVDVLDPPAPKHAFPTTYRDGARYNPFPHKLKFPPPVWIRKPSSDPAHNSPVDVDELVNLFAGKLNLRGGLKCRSSPNRAPWYMATLTVPSPAPHPAFIRPAVISPATSTVHSSNPSQSSLWTIIPNCRTAPSLPKWSSAPLRLSSQNSARRSITPGMRSVSSCSSSSSASSLIAVTPPSSPITLPDLTVKYPSPVHNSCSPQAFTKQPSSQSTVHWQSFEYLPAEQQSFNSHLMMSAFVEVQ